MGEPWSAVPDLILEVEEQCRKRLARLAAYGMCFFSIVLVLAVVIAPNFIRTGCRGPLTACKSNLKNMATALEMYAYDFRGEYPERLDQLVPTYMKTLPTCPEAGEVTYTYRCVGRGKRANFSMECSGSHHAKQYSAFEGSPLNYPRYHSARGLADHP